MLIRIGHSPDPDDAFMFYALTAGKVKAEGIEVEHVLEDIESLNRRARTGELDVTAVSAATYVMVHERYRMMDPGASMGKGYGPILVAKEPIARQDLEKKVVAIPGSHTTAALLLRIYVGDPPIIEVAFDKIPKAVLEGQADLGLLIHEGQITHQQMGLVKVLDMGQEWERESGLPLPLGINVMRRDLGNAVHRKLSQALRDSIDYAYAHVDEALEYAMRYGRGIDKETCRKFVLMYVNDYTKRLGPDGKAALERLYAIATNRFSGDAPGHVTTLHASHVEMVSANGRLTFQPVPGSEVDLKADLVLLAMGFLGPEPEGMLGQLGVKMTDRGNVWRDGNWMTSVPGVFTAGDMQRGQSLIVWAIAEARSAARGIDKYLTGASDLPAPL